MPSDMESAEAKARHLLERLGKGKDCEEAATEFLKMGTSIPDVLVLACVGDRAQGVKPSSSVLRLLLEGRANANAVDPQTKGAVLHSACWHGSLEVVQVLLDFGADMEAPEARFSTPPLNTALAAGNAPVCLELLNRNANVLWTHHDGATPLHVATAWIASTHNAQLRIPPMGEEPRAVISMMLHNGVDPTQTEGMTKSSTRGTGMTPLETFRREIATSPWRQKPEIAEKFDQNAKVIHTLLEQSELAVKTKNDGNKAFGERKYADALKLYAESRRVWAKANLRGHHMAVLWSNDAACCKKQENWEQAKSACEEGLKHFCSAKIRKKLEDHHKEAVAELANAAAGIVKEKPEPPPRKPPTKLEENFIEKAAAVDKPIYGEEGSAQGKVEKPGPFICHFQDATEAGFVEGVDGWKDKMVRTEQALDRSLVQEGLMSPDLLDDPKTVQYINPLPPGTG